MLPLVPGGAVEEITLQVNGQTHTVPAGWTVARLLESAGLRREGVAVAIDARVVPRGQHEDRVLAPGEQVEIITAVGGG